MNLRHLISVAAFAAAAALPASRAAAPEFLFGGLDGTQARTGFMAAGNRWSANFSDDFVVKITIGFEALPDNVLAQASSTSNPVTFNSGANNNNKFRLRLEQDATSPDDAAALTGITAATTLPICVGFGISTPAQAAAVAGAADGVVVGSAIVRAAGQSVDAAVALAAELRAGIDAAAGR